MKLKLDIHTHSIASGHGGRDTTFAMAQTAKQKGIEVLGITDHAPATPFSSTESYFRSLALAPRKRFGLTLLYGVELNILDRKGTVDLHEDTLKQLDYAIASMHPQCLKPGSMEENTSAYIEVMKNPYVYILGHIDDVKYPVDCKKVLASAMEHHVLLELNNSSLSPEGYRGDTKSFNMEILSLLKQHNYPVVIGSDSHMARDAGNFTYALSLIKEVGFPDDLIMNTDPALFLDFIGFDD